jgi:hypothetical protein
MSNFNTTAAYKTRNIHHIHVNIGQPNTLIQQTNQLNSDITTVLLVLFFYLVRHMPVYIDLYKNAMGSH